MYPLLLHNKKNIWRILKCSKNYHIKMVKQIHQKLGEKFKIESEISGFQVKQVRTIPELQLTAFSLKHLNTGADYLHIARDDSNNVFCVGFRTTPMDSTGVPHILEHTVLCGSEKFPCRDPFFKMLNRSLSTFMNAMTGSDYTIYPFSTQHPVDFKNLMEVYLDAVFKPNLTELDFFQEGWRLEHENPDDKSSPLIFKGVVFNEMKGVFTDSQQRFCQKLQNELFPSHTYGYISGGDPLTIPKLSWRDLRKFHANHYHPSNSRFFTYGNFPLEDHLEFIHNNYLSKFEKIITNTNVPDEPRWNESRRTDITCGIDPMTQKDRESSVAVSFLLASIQDIPENFTLAIIGDLLMNGPNAPFYKSLIESQYGTNFTASSGFDGSTRTTSFTVGLQGVKRNNLNEVVNRIENTFNEVISEGFPQERIDAVLHNIELGLKHQTTTFGLNLAMNLTPLWNHDGDIIAALEINKNLDNFKKSLSNNPNYLQDKLNKYFKINKHKLILTMSPNADFDNEIKESEKNLLENKIEHLNDVHKENIWNLGQVLKSQQEAKQDTSCLPSLQISDLTSRIQPIITVDNKFDNGVPFQLCEQPTNGVTYFRLLLNTNEIPEHLREFIPLFCDVLTKMGAGDLDFRTLSQKIELISGGLYANVHVTEHPQNLGKYEEGILLSSHCLQSNLDRMLDLWKKILNEIKFDDIARFDSLVKMIATEEANELVYKGHSYAMSYAASSVNFISHMKEQWSGLTHLQRLKALSESSDLSNILNKLKEMSEILLSSNKIRVAINTSPEISDKTISTVGKFMQNIRVEDTERSSMTEIPSSFQPYTCRTHHVFSFPINFAAKSFSSLPYSHPDSASLRVLARLMFQFLHREIREKGGAYGGGAISSPGGPFYFYSYRDPHSTQTFKIFDDAVEYILSGDFTQQDVDEAKLGVFQKVDEPIAPGSKGMRKFLHHISDDMFMDHRSNIINTDSQDLIRVCRTYLREANMEGACLIGPKNEMLEEDPFWNTQVHGQSES